VTRSIAAFFLGGTISMTGHGGGAVVRLGADELLATVPQLAGVDARIEAVQFRKLPSAALSFDDLAELVEASPAVGFLGKSRLGTAQIVEVLTGHSRGT
jgi:L-asparaginase/Glu-tRNA(Gln) amidotransferase subunit D